MLIFRMRANVLLSLGLVMISVSASLNLTERKDHFITGVEKLIENTFYPFSYFHEKPQEKQDVKTDLKELKQSAQVF